MIRVDVGVDDVEQRPVRELLDLREDGGREWRESRVNQHRALFSHLQGDVAAGAGHHVDVALNRHHLDLSVGGILRLGVQPHPATRQD